MSLILLDSGPLGRLTHPNEAYAAPVVEWLRAVTVDCTFVRISQVADYEVRRELIRAGHIRSVTRLNRAGDRLGLAPVTAQAWLKAAELWAVARRVGQPTADDRDLDADVILAATALTYPTSEPVIVATDNARHLARFCDARHWTEIA